MSVWLGANHVCSFDNPQFILGYLQRDGKVYVADKDIAVTSYALDLSVIEFQTLVCCSHPSRIR
jgi:coatomer subunit beta'